SGQGVSHETLQLGIRRPVRCRNATLGDSDRASQMPLCFSVEADDAAIGRDQQAAPAHALEGVKHSVGPHNGTSTLSNAQKTKFRCDSAARTRIDTPLAWGAGRVSHCNNGQNETSANGQPTRTPTRTSTISHCLLSNAS